MQVRNQTYLRMKNKEDIINLLREKSRSYSDIARVLRLSNTAISKIADDLISHNLIKREGDTKGRTGITLSINADFGYVLAVDFSGRELNLCAADFESRILLQRNISEVVRFERRDFDRVIETMREMIGSETLKDRKLCCISVATPGKLKDSGEFLLNPRFQGFENVSIRKVLGDTFGCDVVVKNDVNLAMEGEKAYGSALRDVKNALMLHVDVGTGAALMLNGKIYEGSHGFAGEIGYFRLNMFSCAADSFDNLSYFNFYDSVSLYSSLSILKLEVQNGAEGYLKAYAEEKGISPSELTIKAMTEAYRAGDPLVRKVLNASGRVIGTVAANIAEFLDVDTVVLNGAVFELGDPFLEVVSAYVEGKTVCYPELMEKATLMGAVNAGLTKAFLNNF